MFAPPENCGPSSLATMASLTLNGQTVKSFNRAKRDGALKVQTFHHAVTPLTLAGPARLGHFEGIQSALEFVFGQDLFLSRNLADRSSGVGALLGNFGRAIVTYFWREAG